MAVDFKVVRGDLMFQANYSEPMFAMWRSPEELRLVDGFTPPLISVAPSSSQLSQQAGNGDGEEASNLAIQQRANEISILKVEHGEIAASGISGLSTEVVDDRPPTSRIVHSASVRVQVASQLGGQFVGLGGFVLHPPTVQTAAIVTAAGQSSHGPSKQAALSLLDLWIQQDASIDTDESDLKRLQAELDRDRESYRKLFP